MRDDLINRILLAEAGIRASLDNWISGTPCDGAEKWACQVEDAFFSTSCEEMSRTVYDLPLHEEICVQRNAKFSTKCK